MQTILRLLDGPPHGSERRDNAWQLAAPLSVQPRRHVRGPDGRRGVCAESGHKLLMGHGTIGTMPAQRGEAPWRDCCLDASGLQGKALIPGSRRSTMAELAPSTGQTDKLPVF